MDTMTVVTLTPEDVARIHRALDRVEALTDWAREARDVLVMPQTMLYDAVGAVIAVRNILGGSAYDG